HSELKFKLDPLRFGRTNGEKINNVPVEIYNSDAPVPDYASFPASKQVQEKEFCLPVFNDDVILEEKNAWDYTKNVLALLPIGPCRSMGPVTAGVAYSVYNAFLVTPTVSQKEYDYVMSVILAADPDTANYGEFGGTIITHISYKKNTLILSLINPGQEILQFSPCKSQSGPYQ
ncbi:hypothetical protein OSTOST_20197, partial [Ostertagia ostertagi]